MLLQLFVSAALLVGAEPKAPTPEQIARAIEELADDRFAVREKASEFLWSAGRAAEPALRAAVRNADPEVARRAQTILDRFKYGIYPETPEEVVELVQRFLAGNRDAKREVFGKLSGLGRYGHAAMLRLVESEPDAETRQTLTHVVAGNATKLAPSLLVEGRTDELESLLELGLHSDSSSAGQNYAAWHFLRGQGQQALLQLKNLLVRRNGESTAAQEAKVLLHYLLGRPAPV